MDLLPLAVFGLIVILIGVTIWALSAFWRWMKWPWTVKGNMAIIAVAGWMILNSLDGIRDAYHHTGPGIVWHGPDEEREPAEVSESMYKRDKFVSYGMLLCLGLYFLNVATRIEHHQKAAAEATSAMHEAEANRLDALISATGDNIDEQVWQCATDKAMKSHDYLLAEAASRAKSPAFNYRCRIRDGKDR